MKSNKFKIILHSGLIGLFVYLLIGLFLCRATAQTMSNRDYIIQTEELNTASDSTDNGDYSLKSTDAESNPRISQGVNFKVKTGFDNTTSPLPFSVSLSSDIADFGDLSPTNPIVRSVDLSVYSLSTLGYSIIVFEDHPLKSDKGSILDTTCDNGECSEENSSEWINTLTYGFGYRCHNMIGFDCDLSFHNSNFYKSFADSSNSKSPQSVMAGIGSNNKSIRLSYKVNIPGTQAQGIYTNTITFITVPNF